MQNKNGVTNYYNLSINLNDVIPPSYPDKKRIKNAPSEGAYFSIRLFYFLVNKKPNTKTDKINKGNVIICNISILILKEIMTNTNKTAQIIKVVLMLEELLNLLATFALNNSLPQFLQVLFSKSKSCIKSHFGHFIFFIVASLFYFANHAAFF